MKEMKEMKEMGSAVMSCACCGRELPLEHFEQYPTGTRRLICRRCHYEQHTHAARRRWVMRQRARALYNRE